MSQSCRLFCGFILSFIGWIGLIIATATNDWVITCKYGMHTCKKMDELGSKGLWAECVVSTSLYHCTALNQILALPAYIQTSRALMVAACIAGFPSLALVMMALPCVKLANETDGAKHKRAILGGILILLMSLCGLVSTVWFPIGAHHDERLMSFGLSLYSGWVGSALCLLGGAMITCCSGGGAQPQNHHNRFYYSKQSGTANAMPPAANHAKNAHV
ncbi:claudin-11b [Alosa alosa]|nr:claudin-11b [Alosa sapidissima]XP_041924867.1 claudin-11b [Alosa sapidissima]XP_048122155.1 claudin-11b [Alosa alosa]